MVKIPTVEDIVAKFTARCTVAEEPAELTFNGPAAPQERRRHNAYAAIGLVLLMILAGLMYGAAFQLVSSSYLLHWL